MNVHLTVVRASLRIVSGITLITISPELPFAPSLSPVLVGSYTYEIVPA
nr:MAG TPA: hypothetical protein [Caudoviricetes sp.]